jgi:hypothetical protein
MTLTTGEQKQKYIPTVETEEVFQEKNMCFIKPVTRMTEDIVNLALITPTFIGPLSPASARLLH